MRFQVKIGVNKSGLGKACGSQTVWQGALGATPSGRGAGDAGDF